MTYAGAKEKVLQVMRNAAIESDCKNDGIETSEICDAMRIACEALDKGIPKKPVNRGGLIKWDYCPACDKAIKPSQFGNAFCCFCGQSIDWSDCDA